MRLARWAWLLSLFAGFSIGVLYAWEVAPIHYVDTTPDTLRLDFKERFRAEISSAYAATGNLDRARARLALLGDADPVRELTAQAQRILAAGEPFQNAQQLALLASDLQSGSSSVALPSATLAATMPAAAQPVVSPTSSAVGTLVGLTQPASVDTPLPTVEPSTPTPRPTRTPVPTAGAPFILVSQDRVCNPDLTDGLLQITVLDVHNHPMPGVQLDVTWSAGEELIFTGFKPEISDGYADFVMQPGLTYSVQVADAGAPISDLIAPSCKDAANQSYLGGLKLVVRQP